MPEAHHLDVDAGELRLIAQRVVAVRPGGRETVDVHTRVAPRDVQPPGGALPPAVGHRHDARPEGVVVDQHRADLPVAVAHGDVVALDEVPAARVVRVHPQRIALVDALFEHRKVVQPAVDHVVGAPGDQFELVGGLRGQLLEDAFRGPVGALEQRGTAVDQAVVVLDRDTEHVRRFGLRQHRGLAGHGREEIDAQAGVPHHRVDRGERIGVRVVEQGGDAHRLLDAGQDPPVVAALPLCGDDGGRVLHVRLHRHTHRVEEVDVLPFQPVRGGQKIVRHLTGDRAVQIDGHDQVQLLERPAQPVVAADRQQRVARHHDQRADRVLRVLDEVRQERGGQIAADGAHLTEGTVVERVLPFTLRALHHVGDAARVDVAAAPAEVAGEQTDHGEHPVGQGALATLVHSGRHVDARARCRAEVVGDLPDRVGLDAGDRGDPVDRVLLDEVEQLVDAASVTFHLGPVIPDPEDDLVQDSGEEVEVGVRLDQQHVPGLRRRRLDTARIDEQHCPAATLYGTDLGHRIRDVDQRHVRDLRVAADAQEVVGVQ
ncbi:hypothetical protein MLGJGCBP_00625 [Rhodococcus sp. T7]|nr:hypothetical protein MLGJGCBP_00625 [Rhodococcus sp. T7]